jgi:hypothetical protein
LFDALEGRYGRLAYVNAWTQDQTFQADVAVNGNAAVTGTLEVNGASTFNTVEAASVTSGPLSATTGTFSAGLSASAPLQASGAVGATNEIRATGTMAATNGNTYPLASVRGTTQGANEARLTTRAWNLATASSWSQVALGLSYDVDGAIGAGGFLRFTQTGAQLSGGTAATPTVPVSSLQLLDGHLQLLGTAPDKNVAIRKTATSANVCAAWGNITTDSVGGVTLNDGYNITGVSISGTDVLVTLGEGFANTAYVCHVEAVNSGTVRAFPGLKTTGTTTIGAYNHSTNIGFNLATGTMTLDVTWYGRQ